MAARLVEVAVHADDEVEGFEGALEPRPVRRREHRVPGQGHERVNLPRTRREQLVGEGGDRKLPRELRQPAHAALPPAQPERRHHAARHRIERRGREHGAARAVEVAGDEVHELDQPVTRHAVRLDRGSHAAVDGGARGRRQLPGEPLDRGGREPRRVRHPPRRKGADRLRHDLEPVGERRQPTRRGEPLLEEHVQDRREQQRIRARPDEQVLVGEPRGLGPARVHDRESSTAGAELPDPTGKAGRRHHRALRDGGVAAEDQDEAGAVEVGHRLQQLVAVHPGRHEQVREHVHGDGGVDVAAPHVLEEVLQEHHQLVVVGARVAPVERDGVGPVGLPDRPEPRRDEIEGIVPPDRLPARAGAGATERGAQPVRVVVQVGERHALGADRAAAERIVRVAADVRQAVAIDGDAEATARFAERTGPVDDARRARREPGARVFRGHVGSPTTGGGCSSMIRARCPDAGPAARSRERRQPADYAPHA
jgi:hypothetical protein